MRTAEHETQVFRLPSLLSIFHADNDSRLGQLEREFLILPARSPGLILETAKFTSCTARNLSMSAMRLPSSQARYPHLQGEILEYGQLDERASRGASLIPDATYPESNCMSRVCDATATLLRTRSTTRETQSRQSL